MDDKDTDDSLLHSADPGGMFSGNQPEESPHLPIPHVGHSRLQPFGLAQAAILRPFDQRGPRVGSGLAVAKVDVVMNYGQLETGDHTSRCLAALARRDGKSAW